ncbi:exodeoxyribonuclease VII large subunit [Microbacterium testaceum]|jgi:exodeoxyribonuclease VII large subunit|uniref:Exodeoxyribonuclease 7 large subunit n=1 Tax=Microbacterium testaceum TaxID=2033 RepID=A0A147F424_MICTE|nr:exodeoxyribonuclease VII large subunit [Microbacterium testaceum]KTS02009.1 exodeoxyribonuclease VII large subunit [Microbacterium testaceum]KTS08569.1 exodeoxyribonuclease VII large subunit [Microbacterium testaceum]KTS63789.1 exodeoxyribonuclease VII large subunit [Microbacterium testaceum]
MTSFHPETVPGEAPPADSVHPRDSRTDTPTSVSRLNDTIRGFIERWGSVWVEGEITSFNRRGGNVFGRLKDLNTESTVAFRIWSSTLARLPKDFQVGDHVVACVKADYFPRTGDFSFAISAMRHVGLGEQLERLERLRVQLRSEGLFDPVRKKKLPFLPHCIGLITGENSDAEKDVHRNAELRWPRVNFRTKYAAVQGDRCVPETLAALKALDADPEVDVIIIARGGGDPQTLLGFSDERLLRAVAAASTPVVSAIGHENDRPLLDEVADLRASTPTDAAKRVVPDVAEQRALVAQLRARLTGRLTQRVLHDIAQLEQIRSRPSLRTPHAMLTSRAQELWMLSNRGRDIVDRRLESEQRRTRELSASLRALSPLATLARGYAIAQVEGGAIVRDASQAPAGTALTVTVARGSLTARSEGEIDETPVAPLDGEASGDGVSVGPA